jgi:hypothetical protein
VTFTGRDNKLQYPFQTSWGSTTRMIGAVIMAHGDNNGLVLPPKIAPIQLVVVPIAPHKPGVLEAAAQLRDRLTAAGYRVKLDDSDNSMGWKCAEYEMKGVPVRVELGPRDIEAGSCVLVRRNDGVKTTASLNELEPAVKEQLELVQKGMFEKAKAEPRRPCLRGPLRRGGQEAPGRARRLHPDDVVRRRGVRAQNEGAHRHVVPLHAPQAGASGRRVPDLRQAGQKDDLLGHRVLSGPWALEKTAPAGPGIPAKCRNSGKIFMEINEIPLDNKGDLLYYI